MQSCVTKGGLAAPTWKLSTKTQLTKVFIELLTSNALWAKVARQQIDDNLQNKGKPKRDLYHALENTNNTRGWPRKWAKWIKAWKDLGGTFIDSFTSPFIQKKDLYVNDKPVTEFSTKVGLKLLKDNNQAFILSEKQWHLVWNLPIANIQKELFWKFIHNSIPTGNRVRHFADSSCPFCDQLEYNRDHLLINCWFSKTIIKRFNNIGKFNPPISNEWRDWIIDILGNGNKKRNGPITLLFIIFLNEMIRCFREKKDDDSAFITDTTIANRIKSKAQFSLKLSRKTGTGKKISNNFEN